MRHDENFWIETQKVLGRVIKYHRQRLRFNQSEMARELGCQRGQLAMVETAKRLPNPEMMEHLVKLTGEPIDQLVRRTYL